MNEYTGIKEQIIQFASDIKDSVFDDGIECIDDYEKYTCPYLMRGDGERECIADHPINCPEVVKRIEGLYAWLGVVLQENSFD